MADEILTKDDLVLLMESYKNMISMHHTVLEQSNRMIEQLASVVAQQDGISLKQRDTCSILNSVSTKLDTCVSKLEGFSKDIEGIKDNVIEKVNSHSQKSIEDHGKLANKIHLGWIGMGTIILGLITLSITVYSTFHSFHP